MCIIFAFFLIFRSYYLSCGQIGGLLLPPNCVRILILHSFYWLMYQTVSWHSLGEFWVDQDFRKRGTKINFIASLVLTTDTITFPLMTFPLPLSSPTHFFIFPFLLSSVKSSPLLISLGFYVWPAVSHVFWVRSLTLLLLVPIWWNHSSLGNSLVILNPLRPSPTHSSSQYRPSLSHLHLVFIILLLLYWSHFSTSYCNLSKLTTFSCTHFLYFRTRSCLLNTQFSSHVTCICCCKSLK